jgi:CheY-like chemotaxis protein
VLEEEMRILIVEDDPANQRLLRLLLEQRGHEVVCADDAAAAVALLEDAFDVVLLDRNVPRGGAELVLRSLREKAKRTRAIAVTGAPPHASAEILALGFDAFFSKPIHVATFASDVERIVNGVEPEPATLATLERRLAPLRERYMRELPSLLAALRAFVKAARHDGNALEDAITSAHKIGGTAASYGATAISTKAQALEDALIEIAWKGEAAGDEDWSKVDALADVLSD